MSRHLFAMLAAQDAIPAPTPTAADERAFFARWADGLRKAGKPTAWLQYLTTQVGTNKETSMNARQFAEPTSPFTANDADLDSLRAQLAEAEEVAASRHSTWVQKTRAGQDVRQLTRQLEAAEIDRARKLAHESRHERIAAHAAAIAASQRGVDAGQFAEPVSPWPTAT